MIDSSRNTDIYSFGVIILEMLAPKDHNSSTFLQSEDLNMLTALRILVLHHKISDIFSSKILKDTINQNSSIEKASI